MAESRSVRALQVGFALGLSALLAAEAASSLVAPLSRFAVAALLNVTAPLAALGAAAPADVVEEIEAPGPAELVFEAATKGPQRHRAKAPVRAKPAALFVSQATVLKLANSAARPRGTFVARTDAHPAGLRLSGVAALGIGVQDGDILIEALGITPHGPGEIIGAILEARAKQARFLSGTLWRQGQTFPITVEQPYLPARSPS